MLLRARLIAHLFFAASLITPAALAFQAEKRVANNMFPQWSHDGKQIVFASDRDGDPEIYVMNADGSGQTRLTGLGQ